MLQQSVQPRARRRALLALALATVAVFVTPTPAQAHNGTCLGLPITITTGSPDDDVIQGTPGDDIIQGFAGNDTIYGGGGNDIICGGGGWDRIFGEDGDDTLIGGWGNDWLAGGDGNDDLRGNAGNDRLYGNRGVDVARGWIGSDACGGETTFNCEMKKRWGHDTEEWRPLVEKHFGPLGVTLGVSDLVEEALGVIECESSGEPFIKNKTSNAAGLFQFLSGTWSSVSEKAGETETVFHPEANISNAAWLVEYSVGQGKYRWSQWAKACWPFGS